MTANPLTGAYIVANFLGLLSVILSLISLSLIYLRIFPKIVSKIPILFSFVSFVALELKWSHTASHKGIIPQMISYGGTFGTVTTDGFIWLFAMIAMPIIVLIYSLTR